MDQYEITDFVKGTLGCKCPDGLFYDSSCEEPATAGPLFGAFSQADPRLPAVIRRAIHVSDRLLVAVTVTNRPYMLSDILRAGVKIRDAQGFNRFRLALEGVQLSDALVAQLLAPFDDRVHLHQI